MLSLCPKLNPKATFSQAVHGMVCSCLFALAVPTAFQKKNYKTRLQMYLCEQMNVFMSKQLQVVAGECADPEL